MRKSPSVSVMPMSPLVSASIWPVPRMSVFARKLTLVSPTPECAALTTIFAARHQVAEVIGARDWRREAGVGIDRRIERRRGASIGPEMVNEVAAEGFLRSP